MAKPGSPENVGERSMFAPDAVPFALPAKVSSAQSLAHGSANAEVAKPAVGTPPEAKTSRTWTFVPGWLRALPAPPTRSGLLRAVGLAASTELDRGIAFVLAPVFMATGALVYFSLDREPGIFSLATGCAFLALCVFASRAKPALNVALVVLLLCVTGSLLAKIETWRAGTKMLGSEVTTQLTGRVVEIEHMANGRVRLTLDVAGTERPVLRYAPERVRVSARRIPEGVAAGASVTGLVRLMPPSGPVRPGSYDFSFESYFDGIGASGFFLRGPEFAREAGPASMSLVFRASVERIRQALAQRIASHIGGPEGEIAAALVVGVRAGIPDDVNDALRRSGIYHVISISGLHMALVAGTIMVLLRSGFALVPDFSSRHPVKKYAAGLALVGLAGYLFISGAEVAAQRSFIMLAVMLVAVLFDRAALTLRNLAIAAIIVIAVTPHEVVGPSFQMSFAATAALVGAYAAWSDWRADHPGAPPVNRSLVRWAMRYVLLAAAGLAVTSIVAGGATAIYAAWHFQQMPSLGLFTNLAAMPIVSAVVMPFAVFGALAMPFGLDGPFFHVMGLGLSATLAIARWFAERSPTDMVGLVPPLAVAVLTTALLVATLFSTWLRVAAVPIAFVGLVLLIGGPEADLLVSEDGRLVGLNLGDGRIAVNRARPNEFTAENWQRAMQAREVVKPEGRQARAAAIDTDEPNPAATRPEPVEPPAGGFACAEGLCLARHPSGAIVAHALDAQAALDACASASVVVIEDASAKEACRWKDVLVVTGQDLALDGSAAITFAGQSAPTVQHALNRPYRPWHEQRSFSRAARGLAAYRPPSERSQQNKAADPAQGQETNEPTTGQGRSDIRESPPADADRAQAQ